MKYLNFPGKVRRIVRISQKEWGTVNPLMGSKTEAFRILSYAALWHFEIVSASRKDMH